MNFKMHLREYLRTRGMTAADLSRMTGIPKQSISDWLAGVTPRDLRQLKKVAEFFGVSIDELVFGEPRREPERRTITVTSGNNDGWVTGVYEVRFRRVGPPDGKR